MYVFLILNIDGRKRNVEKCTKKVVLKSSENNETRDC